MFTAADDKGNNSKGKKRMWCFVASNVYKCQSIILGSSGFKKLVDNLRALSPVFTL